jgi:DNA-binding XRE family transcriptional regulator
MNNNAVAINLINLRTTLDMSQSKFADSIGVSRSRYHGYETHRRRVPYDIAKKIIDLYEIKDVYNFLFGFYENNK